MLAVVGGDSIAKLHTPKPTMICQYLGSCIAAIHQDLDMNALSKDELEIAWVHLSLYVVERQTPRSMLSSLGVGRMAPGPLPSSRHASVTGNDTIDIRMYISLAVTGLVFLRYSES